jgi:uncharacterized membrane protein YebE (DUF533 family)
MSLVNNLVKAAFIGGTVVGSAVAYAHLNDEQKQKVQQNVARIRRKVADLIAPNDGAYVLPKEVEEELAALLNE